MDTFLARLTRVTYDLAGIVFPGLCFHLLCFVEIATYWWVRQCPLPDTAAQVHTFAKTHTWFVGCLVCLSSYFVGRVLLVLGKHSRGASLLSPKAIAGLTRSDNLRTLARWLYRVVLAGSLKPLLSKHDPELSPLMVASAKRMGLGETADWKVFSSVATRALLHLERASRIEMHQNKYTLDRSLATAAAISFWVAACLAVLARSELLAGEALACLVLAYVFESEHEYHWKLWGNTVISETYAMLFVRAPTDELRS